MPLTYLSRYVQYSQLSIVNKPMSLVFDDLVPVDLKVCLHYMPLGIIATTNSQQIFYIGVSFL